MYILPYRRGIAGNTTADWNAVGRERVALFIRSLTVETNCSPMTFRATKFSSDYRRLYRKTTILALVTAVLSIVLAIIPLSFIGQGIAMSSFLLLLSLLSLALGSLAGLVVLGGIIALRRDALERVGRPYFSTRPRERSPGIAAHLRRWLLNLLPGSRSRLRLRPGEWVRVRPFSAIATTLDENGSLDALPFMPEMVPYCGRHFRVFRRIDKIHDYYTPGGTGLRRLHDSVTLDDLRCSGAAHGGCQAACQFIWKEAWLEPIHRPRLDAPTSPIPASRLEDLASRVSQGGTVRYVCQMTELPRAAQLLWWSDPRHYLREFWSGNVRFTPFARAVGLALFNIVQKRTQGPAAPFREIRDREADESPPLDLQPGDIVRVKPKQEIEKTLTKSKNLGLWFDVEMHRYCGGEFRVARRVQTIIREENGSMLSLKNPCIVLEGAVGTGEYLGLCPQSDLIFWREVWLERLSKASDKASHAGLAHDSVKEIPSVEDVVALPKLE